jgi:enamine deaminase RidA (YjgF/YER057c/UK114 family)
MTKAELLSLLSIAGLSLACIIMTILFIISVIGYDAMKEILKDFDEIGSKDDDDKGDIHNVNY